MSAQGRVECVDLGRTGTEPVGPRCACRSLTANSRHPTVPIHTMDSARAQQEWSRRPSVVSQPTSTASVKTARAYSVLGSTPAHGQKSAMPIWTPSAGAGKRYLVRAPTKLRELVQAQDQ